MRKSSEIYTLAFIALIACCSSTFTSCNTDKDDNLDVPSAYSFNRDGSSTVDYSGQTQRLDMMAQLSTYMKTSNTVGASALDAQVLKNMFGNENDPFAGQTYTKDLKSKCFQSDVVMFEEYMDALAMSSQATGAASNGSAGVLVEGSSDPTIGFRVDENGVEIIQVIEKGLMGGVFFYQAMEVYLSSDRMGIIGNSNLTEGENYTNMEHYFDEAFGYFGIPEDYPSAATLDDARFWGRYCNSREEGLYPGIRNEIATAFRTARAAIVAKDYDARDAAIQTIQQKWAIVSAASAVDYLNQAHSSAEAEEYQRHHVLSEAIGFMLALKYHFAGGNSKFPPHYSYTHVGHAMTEIGPSTNLYNVTDTQIESAINHLKMAFPSGEIK